MRTLLTSALLLSAAAVPALAQRVDTRRIDIQPGTMVGTASCRFTAIEGLRLIDMSDQRLTAATWSAHLPDGAKLNVAFSPAPGHEPEADVGLAAFYFTLPEASARPARARISFDGRESDDALWIAPAGAGLYGVGSDARGFSRYVGRLLAATRAELTVLDAKSATLTRLAFDVHTLRRVPELLNLVHWSCTAPDRG